jgi:hypothetical protein
MHGLLRTGHPSLTTIITSLDEERRCTSAQQRRLSWEARSGAPVRSRLTLSDGVTRHWKAPSLERLIEVLDEPKLAKALMLRRSFAHAFIKLAVLLFSGGATGMVRLSFNLGAISRNELLLHLLQAGVALQPEAFAQHIAFEVMSKPGVRFSFTVDRPLPWLTALVLRWRLQRILKPLRLQNLGSCSP